MCFASTCFMCFGYVCAFDDNYYKKQNKELKVFNYKMR